MALTKHWPNHDLTVLMQKILAADANPSNILGLRVALLSSLLGLCVFGPFFLPKWESWSLQKSSGLLQSCTLTFWESKICESLSHCHTHHHASVSWTCDFRNGYLLIDSLDSGWGHHYNQRIWRSQEIEGYCWVSEGGGSVWILGTLYLDNGGEENPS